MLYLFAVIGFLTVAFLAVTGLYIWVDAFDRHMQKYDRLKIYR
jgi:hypothetical protein